MTSKFIPFLFLLLFFTQCKSKFDTSAYTLTSLDNGFQKAELLGADGKPTEVGYLKNGKKQGVWMTFHEANSNLVKTLTSYDNDMKNGIFMEFDSGKLIFSCEYVNDLPDGFWRKFYYGVILEEMTYKKGKKNGFYKKFYDNGKVEQEMEFKNDVQSGKYRQYDFNGNVITEYNYIDGKKQ